MNTDLYDDLFSYFSNLIEGNYQGYEVEISGKDEYDEYALDYVKNSDRAEELIELIGKPINEVLKYLHTSLSYILNCFNEVDMPTLISTVYNNLLSSGQEELKFTREYIEVIEDEVYKNILADLISSHTALINVVVIDMMSKKDKVTQDFIDEMYNQSKYLENIITDYAMEAFVNGADYVSRNELSIKSEAELPF